MNDHTLTRSRGRVDARLDVPAVPANAAELLDRMIDEAVQETFPASDAPTHVRPGSIAGLRAEALSQD